jgi:hypothetical protein
MYLPSVDSALLGRLARSEVFQTIQLFVRGINPRSFQLTPDKGHYLWEITEVQSF